LLSNSYIDPVASISISVFIGSPFGRRAPTLNFSKSSFILEISLFERLAKKLFDT
jgi:hypothetical protein